jgi:hypothetical protein
MDRVGDQVGQDLLDVKAIRADEGQPLRHLPGHGHGLGHGKALEEVAHHHLQIDQRSAGRLHPGELEQIADDAIGSPAGP